MSSSFSIRIQRADYRANSAASYAAERMRQPPRMREIRNGCNNFINTGKNIEAGKMSHRRFHPSLIGAKRASNYETTCFNPLILAILGLLVFSQSLALAAGDGPNLASPVVKQELVSHLMGDFRSAVSDRPLREALQSIASAGKLNLWLDRRADPTALIRSTTEAKTPFQAIVSMATSAGLAAVAVDNIVIVGRQQWVENILGHLLSQSWDSQRVNISWPDLTTPTQAAGVVKYAERLQLPHDLWPAVNWSAMDPEAVRFLVTAQFDLVPGRNDSSKLQKLKAIPKVSAYYPQGSHMVAVRAAITSEDKTAKFKERNSQILIEAAPKAHLAAINRWLTAAPATPVQPLDIDQIRFTLRLENAVAEQVLTQLATAAGRTILFSPQAAELCKKTISLNGSNETLRDLSQRVADSANVKLTWSAKQLEVAVFPGR